MLGYCREKSLRILLAIIISLTIINHAWAEYQIEFEGTGFREYYCGVKLKLTNKSDQNLTEINGFVLSFIGAEQVGRSRGSSFFNVAAGDSQIKTFEAPHAPCDQATKFKFIVGACRLGSSFVPQQECADLIIGVEPVEQSAGVP